ncbi:MFS transporter [Pseudomonas shirazensis]|uniref:MFS transporter n=1 Tax=Pseudomonas shirazensis TaxID=2745494 RepID=UPI003D287829
MPLAIYVFSLCTFAFGLSEFVVAGLVSAMAADLSSSVAAVGAAIAAYALGAAIGAPLLTAALASWCDRSLMLLTVAVLGVGSLLLASVEQVWTLHLVRFVIGLAHGVFMAIAASVAVKLVAPAQAGRALSVVWMGLTVSLALGVPLGTLLGSFWSWRVIFVALALLGCLSLIGLLRWMPVQAGAAADAQPGAGLSGLRAVLLRPLLSVAGVSMLVSVAVFSFFSYVSPYLLEVSQAGPRLLSAGMLLFGACTIAGNLVGGYAGDRFAINRCLLLALLMLVVTLMLLYVFRQSPWAVLGLVGVLGAVFFAIVTLSTLRLLNLAKTLAPHASGVASGLNIAAFNLGTALGGGLGGLLVGQLGLAWLPLAGVGAALLAIAVLLSQTPADVPYEAEAQR